MNQQSPKKQEPQNENQSSPEQPPVKTQQIKRQKKKKARDLKQFLAKPEGEVIEVPKKVEEPQPQKLPVVDQNCKICGQLGEKKKQCEFCKDTVCLEHIRKKRKFKNTNKFVRICDECEDKYLYDKYNNTQSKAQEALAMQEMIVQAKRNELSQLSAGKQTRFQMLKNKQQELEIQKKDYQNKIKNGENDIANKLKRIQNKLNQNRSFQEEVTKLQESLPRPLDDDYNILIEQNAKLNKDLLKYQKLCGQALKAKSVREKELYEAYYNWEKKQTNKAVVSKKKQQCTIY